MSTKKPQIIATKTDHAHLSCTVNGVKFEAEGPRAEVMKKFDAFLEQMLYPVKKAMKDSGLFQERK
jgi:hypothetical protein